MAKPELGTKRSVPRAAQSSTILYQPADWVTLGGSQISREMIHGGQTEGRLPWGKPLRCGRIIRAARFGGWRSGRRMRDRHGDFLRSRRYWTGARANLCPMGLARRGSSALFLTAPSQCLSSAMKPSRMRSAGRLGGLCFESDVLWPPDASRQNRPSRVTLLAERRRDAGPLTFDPHANSAPLIRSRRPKDRRDAGSCRADVLAQFV